MAIVKKLTENRDKTSAVRFSESEYLDLQNAAEMAGVSMSDVIRQGTKIRINELQSEALKKEAERKELINHIMGKSFLTESQKQDILISFQKLFS